MNVLVTGAEGFIGKNFISHLKQCKNVTILEFNRIHNLNDLERLVSKADLIFHLAGVNRPDISDQFYEVNLELTEVLCRLASATNQNVPIVFTSTVHVDTDSDYGKSKKAAEKSLLDYENSTGSKVYIFRLPHVMGKWCKPNYNSVIATFCHQIVNNLSVTINDENAMLNILYIDDLVKYFLAILEGSYKEETFVTTGPIYNITVGELFNAIQKIHLGRENLFIEEVGTGFMRALYATYLSFLNKENFAYSLPVHSDERGVFAEILKTKTSGQFSFLTSLPGIIRGRHYHHSKSEKFLVVSGQATFSFRNLITNERHELKTSSKEPVIVESIPGWVHDIANSGDVELIVLVWANEIFDRENPDTFSEEL